MLVPQALEDQTTRVVASESLGELIEEIFRDGWHERNFRASSLPLINSRGYATDLDIADADIMRREPFYADLMASHRLGLFIGLKIPVGKKGYVAAVERSATAEPPDGTLLERMAAAQAMLASGARAAAAIGAARFESWKELAVESERPMFVIDHLGRLLDRNAPTEPLMGTVFVTAGKVLRLLNVRADIGFTELVAAAVAPSAGPALPRPVFLDIEGQGTLMIDLVRIPRSLQHFHVMASALVVVRMVGGERPSLVQALRRSAGLTEAETRVAMALFNGLTLAGYAARAGISVGTARQQIKAVFRKIGVGRQAELIAHMHSLARED